MASPTARMRLVLHIGIEKTGTTLLQKWLYDNAHALGRHGVFLGHRMGVPNNRGLVACFQSGRDDFWAYHGIATAQEKATFFNGFLDEVEVELRVAEATHHTAIITSEHFHSRLTEDDDVAAFAAFCRRNFSEVKVVCYLREQSAVRRSLFSTAVRTSGTARLDEFQRTLAPDNVYYDYAALADRWARHFGRRNLDLRLYARGRFAGGDLRRDFLTALGTEIDTDQLDWRTESANESLPRLKAHALLALNRAIPHFTASGVDARNARVKEGFLSLDALDVGDLHDDHASEVFETFARSNARLSEAYFDGAPLFERPDAPGAGEKTIALSDVARAVEAVVETAVASMAEPALDETDVNVLRDVALSYETKAPLTRFQAIRLMQIALRGRPDGPLIRQKLRDWQSGPRPGGEAAGSEAKGGGEAAGSLREAWGGADASDRSAGEAAGRDAPSGCGGGNEDGPPMGRVLAD